jgi:protocatechuate 3,4-dioxygenase beta subunit
MRAAILLLALAVPAAALDGTVTNSLNRAPVRKARVTARSRDASYSAVSDASGKWSIPTIPPGEYDIKAECQGFLPPAAKRPPVRVPEEGSVALALTPLGVISGKVVDEEGEPLRNVAVSALAYDYSRPAASLRVATAAPTDDRGEFRLFDLKPGRYYVQAVSPDKKLASLFHGGAAEIAQAAPVDVAPGSEVAGADFRMRPLRRFRIGGKLVDAQTGKPMRALILADAQGAPPRYNAQAGDDGAFEFPAVQPGTYWLTVTQTSGPREMFGEQTVTVSERDVEDVQIAATPVVDISGTVVVEGPPRAGSLNLRVTLEPVDRPGFSATGVPKADGSFTITAGLRIFAVEVAGIPPDLYLRQIRAGAEDAMAGRVDLRRGPAPLTLTLAPNPGRLTGVVLAANGQPVTGALVAITPADPAITRRDLTLTLYSGPDGGFSVGSLAPGDYVVCAWEQFDAGLTGSLEGRRLLGAKGATVTVRAGSEATVRLQPLAPADIEEVRRKLP